MSVPAGGGGRAGPWALLGLVAPLAAGAAVRGAEAATARPALSALALGGAALVQPSGAGAGAPAPGLLPPSTALIRPLPTLLSSPHFLPSLVMGRAVHSVAAAVVAALGSCQCIGGGFDNL